MTWHQHPTFGNWHEWAMAPHNHHFNNALLPGMCPACTRIVLKECNPWRR